MPLLVIPEIFKIIGIFCISCAILLEISELVDAVNGMGRAILMEMRDGKDRNPPEVN